MTPLAFPKTFGGLRTFVQQLVSYAVGAEIAYDPFTQDKFLFDRTDQIAAQTDGYQRTVRVNVVAGTKTYPTGTIYDFIDSQVLSASGVLIPVSVRSREWMNQRDFYNKTPIAQRWYNTSPADPIEIAIRQGGATLTLWPTPLVSRTNGFQTHGHALPGSDWDVDASDVLQGTTESSAFPLPSYCFGVVAFSAAVDWLVQAGVPENDRVQWLIERRKVWLEVALSKGTVTIEEGEPANGK